MPRSMSFSSCTKLEHLRQHLKPRKNLHLATALHHLSRCHLLAIETPHFAVAGILHVFHEAGEGERHHENHAKNGEDVFSVVLHQIFHVCSLRW